jgi:hypothetical protein
MKVLVMAISTLVLLVAPAAAQFYRFVDAGGHVRFTDDINQVPEKQRAAARSYVETRAAPPPAEGTEGKSTESAAVVAAVAPEPAAESQKERLEDMKQKVEAQYQALVKQKEALSKEKETAKTRQQVIEHNQRVEAFNQAAADYEARSNELRRAVEEYNARIMEENAKAAKPVQK